MELKTVLITLVSGLVGALLTLCFQHLRAKAERKRAWDYYRHMLYIELNILWFDLTALIPNLPPQYRRQFPMVTDMWDKISPDLHKYAPDYAIKVLGGMYAHLKLFLVHINIPGAGWDSFEKVDDMRDRLKVAMDILDVNEDYLEEFKLRTFKPQTQTKSTDNI